MKTFCLLTILTFVLLASCNTSQNLSQTDMEAIVHDNNTRLEKCYLAGDADILAEMYDDNAKLSPDGDNFYVGKQKIVAFWKENLAAAKITAMRTNTMSVSGNSEVLYETGITYSETLYKDSLYKNTVKFVNIWKRQPNKSWKLVVDFWNDPKK